MELITFTTFQYIDIRSLYIFSLLHADDVWFSLNGATYQNNSVVTLEDIGEDDDALLCVTNQTDCCRRTYTDGYVLVFGNWLFPNGTKVPNDIVNQSLNLIWNFHRSRGQMVVGLNRRGGGVNGVYRCEIPDAMNVTQTIYIGLYTASDGKV